MSLVRAIRINNGQSPAYSHSSVYGGAETDAHGDAARIPDFFRAPAEVCFHHFCTDAANCAPRVACPEPAFVLDGAQREVHRMTVRKDGRSDGAWCPVLKGGPKHEALVISNGSSERRLTGKERLLTRGKDPRQEAETLDRRQETPDCGERPAPIFAGPGSEAAPGNETLGRCGRVTILPADSENPGGGSPESASPLSAGWSSGSSSGSYPEGRTFESCPRNQLPAEWPAVRPTADECRGSATVALQLLARFSPFHRGGRNGASALGVPRYAAYTIASRGWQPGTRQAFAFRRAAGTVPDGIRRIGKGFSDSCSYVRSCGLDRLPDCGHPGETGSKRVRGARFFICRAYPHAEAPAVATGWGTLFGARPGGAVHHRLSASASAAGYPAGWRHASPLIPKRHTPPGMHATADGATGGERPAHPCTAARRDNDLPRANGVQRIPAHRVRGGCNPFPACVGRGPARTGKGTMNTKGKVN